MTKNYRKALIAVVTFLGGLYFFLEYMLPKKIGAFEFGVYHDEISKAVQVVGVMAVGLGIINILKVHGARIFKSREGWGNSVALIVGLFVTLAIEGTDLVNAEKSVHSWREIESSALFAEKIHTQSKNDTKGAAEKVGLIITELERIRKKGLQNEGFLPLKPTDPSQQKAAAVLSDSLDQSQQNATALRTAYEQNLNNTDELYETLRGSLRETLLFSRDLSTISYEASAVKKTSKLVHEGFFVPLGSAMFALLAFYIANAAYRSFRVKSLEALLMMIAAIIVMLGQIPYGPLYIYEGLPEIRLMLLKNISTPAFRAVFFGSAIAGLAMAVRMWLSLEESPLASEDSTKQKGKKK